MSVLIRKKAKPVGDAFKEVGIRPYAAKKGSGSSGFITGRVLEQGTPVVRRVMCYHRKSGNVVGLVWSSSNGDYRFDSLIAGTKYFVLSVDENDDETQYNAVVQDMITAELTT